MKSTIKNFVMLTALCVLVNFVHAQTTSTVSLTITPPASTGTCTGNLYTLMLDSANGARIVINASLINSPASCSGASPIYLDSVTATNNIKDVVTYNNGQTMSFTVMDNAIASISYHAYIDCSVVPSGGSTVNVNFLQTFADSTGGHIFNVNNTTVSSFTAPNIQRPVMTMDSITQNKNQYAHYLTPSYFYFKYVNTGFTTANIRFDFNGDSTYCGNITTDSIQYATGMNGSYAMYQPNATAVINVNDTLVIRQSVHTLNCITETNTCGYVTATLQWRCNVIPKADSVFCNSCTGDLTSTYKVSNNDTPVVKIERITPADSLYDFSCMNDTTPFVHWQFRVTNSGTGAMDSLNFKISQNTLPSDIRYLSLIPYQSFQWIKSANSQCTVTDSITHRTQWLCQNLVPDAMHEAVFRIKNFGENDTLFISFNTMKCSEENSALFNIFKNYNHWAFLDLFGRKICGDSSLTNFNISTPNSPALSTHTSGASLDVLQKLNFTPTVTDLSVPANTAFGDSALMKIRMKGFLGDKFDYQLYGCTQQLNTCTMQGWLRVEVYCDTTLRIENPAMHGQLVYYRNPFGTVDTLIIKPDFVYADMDTTQCEAGHYNYYFNMNDSAFRVFMDSANFEFTVQACCGIVEKGKTPYRINFYTIPNPNNCFTLTQTAINAEPVISDANQQWLPLSYKGDDISVHCPGCLAPGAVISAYQIKRITFGLRDSNNDGLADNGLTKIVKGDSYYNQFHEYMNENVSSYGDTLEDYLSAYFQDGDNTSGGYTYQQMVNAGVAMHYLQLSRTIPAGLDTFKLNIDSVTLYIDTVVTGGNACIDCADFGMNGANTVTQRVVTFNSADAYAHCVVADIPTNKFLFTFCDSTGGNINAFQTYGNSTYPFVAFKAGQRYRLKVRYAVCGNYRLPYGYSSGNQIITTSQISNILWLTGKQQVTDAISQMPNDTNALHNDTLVHIGGYTITGNSCCTPVDTGFINNHLFFCETFGGRHYFAPTSYFNTSTVVNTKGCEKLLSVNYYSDIAAHRNHYFDAYPYEYRPPLLFADTVIFNIPSGYSISLLRMRTGAFYNSSSGLTTPFSAWNTLTPPQTTGTVSIAIDTIPFQCLTQNINAVNPDTLFAGDQYTSLTMECYIRKIGCDSLIDSLPRNTILISTANTAPEGFSTTCSLPEELSDSIHNVMPKLLVHPNLIALFQQNIVFANQQQLCWNITLKNPTVTLAGGVSSSAADNVFLGVPLNGAIPALANWTFATQSGTVNANNGIIPVANTIAPNGTITGKLCATFVSCDSSITTFPLYYGWNCNGFPTSTAQIPDTVCGVNADTLKFIFQPSQLTAGGKTYETPYTLCDTVTIHTTFKNTQTGNVYPQQATLLNLANNLTVANVWLLNTATGDTATLNGTTPVWNITQANMDSVGYPSGGLNSGGVLEIYFDLIPECAYAGDTLLPDILISGISYCGETLTAIANFNNNGNFYYGATQCTDCWQITKTADRDTAAAVSDIVTYTISVCNNSANTQTGVLADVLPSGFVQTSSTLPGSVTLNSMQCATFMVSGYFTQSGSCLYNVASVTSPANTTWKDSVCVVVTSLCNVAGAIQLADSSFSSSLNTSYNNTTFVVQGRFYVNSSLTLTNCHVYTYPASQIIVLGGGTLTLVGTTIEACSNMWRGIILEKNSKLVVRENSIIRDADNGITALHGSAYWLKDSRVIDCVRSIYVPQQSGKNNIQATVDGCKFGLYAAAFKPDYAGQPAHDVIPRACIEVYDVVMTIHGKNKRNEFYNSNWGIYAHRSVMEIENCKFNNMSKGGPVYGNATHKGSAIVSESSSAASAGSLTVLPLDDKSVTIDTCNWGVYTEWTNTTLTGISTRHVSLAAVFNTRCNAAGMTTIIKGCDLEAAKKGIEWQNSELGAMVATNNIIKVTAGGSSAGINVLSNSLTTGNYKIENNQVEAQNGSGIVANAAYNVNVINNTVKLTGNTTNGISLTGCDNSQVSCNTVKGKYPTLTYQNRGINISHSTNNLMNCNNMDSTYFGVYFEGVCTGTRFRGTEMKNHFEGLRLFTNAVIDTQAHAGNRWYGPFTTGGYGANNLNYIPSSNLYLSAFLIDFSNGGTYIPNIPINNTGWITNQTGTEFECAGYLMCEGGISPQRSAATSLQLTIAKDSLETADFTDESKVMAKNYLYKDLKENDSLVVNSNQIISAFMDEQKTKSTGYLYRTNKLLAMGDAWNEEDVINLFVVDSLINLVTDSIYALDSLAATDSTINNFSIRETLFNQLQTLWQNREYYINQHKTAITPLLALAQDENVNVIPEGQPEENDKFMNEIEIQYKTGGLNAIINSFNGIENIARQCPHVGGKAVYKARGYMSFINDSIIYDDAFVCSQAGFRKAATEKENNIISDNVTIIPNPATDNISVILSDNMNGVCEILFYDAVGKQVLLKEIDCNKKVHTFYIGNLAGGVYTVKIRQEGNVFKYHKIVVKK